VIYLDTSALMKLVHVEAGSDALRRYLMTKVKVPKLTSAVAITELPRAVRRANYDSMGNARDRRMLEAEMQQSRDLLQTLRMIEVTRALLADAASADGPFLRSIDAIHLAAATRIAIGISAFITYDKRLASAAEEAGLPVAEPS
jgi:predicted nucleic acid-binding protein